MIFYKQETLLPAIENIFPTVLIVFQIYARQGRGVNRADCGRIGLIAQGYRCARSAAHIRSFDPESDSKVFFGTDGKLIGEFGRIVRAAVTGNKQNVAVCIERELLEQIGCAALQTRIRHNFRNLHQFAFDVVRVRYIGTEIFVCVVASGILGQCGAVYRNGKGCEVCGQIQRVNFIVARVVESIFLVCIVFRVQI